MAGNIENETPNTRPSEVTGSLRRHRQTGNTTRNGAWCYTPFRKTPAVRRLHAHLINTSGEETDGSSNLKELVNKTWRLYKVTPLYKFSREARSLKHYSRQLGALVQAESIRGCVEPGEQADSASFRLLPVPRSTQQENDEDSTVEITLKLKPKRGQSRGDPKVVLTAILACVELRSSLRLGEIERDFTILPLMLVRGTLALTAHVHTWLKSEFDCCISELTLPPLYLREMLAMWAGTLTGRGTKPAELVYEVPAHIKSLKSITMTIESFDCQKLWNTLVGEGVENVTEDQISSFVLALQNHFTYHFSITLDAMQLTRVGTPLAYVSLEGKLKMFSQDHVMLILAHLTELAANQVLTW